MHINSRAKNRILKKIRSRAGSSVIFALLLMLVVVMVSVAIVTSSVSAAKTVSHDKENQQNYLTLSSAAQLIRDSICTSDNSFTVAFLEEKGDDGTWSQQSSVLNPPLPTGTFAECIIEGLTFLLKEENAGRTYVYEDKNPYTIECNGLDTITMTLSMEAISLNGSSTNKTYKLTANLVLKDSSGADEYYMKLMMDAQFTTPPKTIVNGNIRTTSITYTWDSLNATIE